MTQVSSMSTAEFAEKLGESGLLSPDEVHDALETLSGGASIVDGGDFAKRLVEAGKLTAYQATAVLEKRLKELSIGNYEVLARLGAGAMGTVYKARHRRMKRIVAIKVLSRNAANDAFIQRFQREVETLAQLSHPNVIMAFDADEAEIGHFLVMEFVDGRDLATMVQQQGKMSLHDALTAVLQAARGLEYAHGKNVVHRDIKPANIMWDVSGVVKVADLGLARLGAKQSEGETALTQAGSILGTVDYMAPEQAVDSAAIDHRADIYSLGCTLHFLLTAEPPYRGNSAMAVLLKHRDAPIPSLCAARSDVPAALDALFMGMLAKQPESRIASMTEVVKRLEQVQAELRNAATLAGTVVFQPSIQDLTVILVEPSRTQAGIVKKYLQDLGITRVHSTTSGAQGLETAKQQGGQVFICSLYLGDMTGMKLAEQVRADPTCANIAFVLATSGSEDEDVATIKAMPRTVLVSKPFDAKKLAVALAAATGCRS